jgi:hypothetical protein
MKRFVSSMVFVLSFSAQAENDKVRKYTIKRGEDERVFDAYVAPNVGLTLQFPEPWVGKVFCGDCLFPGTESKGQLFKIEVNEQTNQIAIVTTGIPGSAGAPPAPGYMTALTVTLKSGITVSTILRAGLPEQSLTRVIFEMPQQDSAESILGIEKKKQEQKFNQKVIEAGTQRSLDFLMGETKCQQFSGAPYRSDGLIVRLKQLCKTKRSVWVVFEAQNRLKDTDIQLKEAILSSSTSLEGKDFRFRKDLLGFDEKTSGIALVEFSNEEPLPPSWSLTITEEGGKERQVVASGITF